MYGASFPMMNPHVWLVIYGKIHVKIRLEKPEEIPMGAFLNDLLGEDGSHALLLKTRLKAMAPRVHQDNIHGIPMAPIITHHVSWETTCSFQR